MVSPSSSSTRRSTPCVLGCCGPRLTVIVSLRISAIAVHPLFDELADCVYQRAMHFLNARCEVVRNVHVHICSCTDWATASACKGYCFQTARLRIFQPCEHIYRRATRRDAHSYITGAPVGF